MAKKGSAGGGIVIIGLIVLVMIAKYWYLLVTFGAIALIVWGIAKVAKSWSISGSQNPAWKTQTQSQSDQSIFTPVLLKVSSEQQPQIITDHIETSFSGTQQSKFVSSDDLWVPCDRTITIAGHSISGGMIYFGSGLKSINQYNDEPALIRPKLKVDSDNSDREGNNIGYWLSYSQIHPTSRAAFLEWLSKGKKDPTINIGYVFIYFYGLERRALADVKESIAARNDVSAIVTEVKRLLSIYGENNSFRGHASKFLDAIQASQVTAPLYRTSPLMEPGFWEIPLTLKIALGQMANDGVPMSVEWALAWAENDPTMPRRMPSQRCASEFRELFKIRYSEKFGEGLRLKPNKARLTASYYPASPSFSRPVDIPISDLPDITATTGSANKIRDIVTVCTDELEGYSRYLGRKPDGRNSIEATSYLPQPLLQRHAGTEFQKLSNWLSSQIYINVPVSVSLSSVLQHVPSINREGFGKKEVTAIANLLGKMSIGIEPDPRFGSFVPKPEHSVVLFKIGDSAPSSPSAEYSAATVVLHLASAVANADGSVDAAEELRLEEHLEAWLHLSTDEKMRLRAHTQWLLSSFPGMNGVKKRIELLKQDQREALGRFLVGIAQADGYIDPTEMKMLTKIYEMLGLDIQGLYSHAHAAAIDSDTVQTANGELLFAEETTIKLSAVERTLLKQLSSTDSNISGVKLSAEERTLLKQISFTDNNHEVLRRPIQVSGKATVSQNPCDKNATEVTSSLLQPEIYNNAHASVVEPIALHKTDFVRPQGYSIPAPPPKPTTGILLDMSRIEAKLAETMAVSAILNNIFAEVEPEVQAAPLLDSITSDVSIVRLDPESFAFMQVLAAKQIWARNELEKLADLHSLMLDGTLDCINDASYDHFGGPFFEGDDPIEINTEFAKEITA